MIFVDTSAFYSASDEGDPNHSRALALFQRAVEHGEALLTHNYAVVETEALLQKRMGLDVGLDFLADLARFRVHWVNAGEHERAVELLANRARRDLSVVDCASFIVMREEGATHALAFDGDFEREGFVLYTGGVR